MTFSIWSDLTSAEVLDGQPVYRIFILGTRSSGKTVFLSALFGHLRIQNPVNQFAIEVTSTEDSKLLQRYYDSISNPEGTWPEGNVNSKEFEFRCVRRQQGGGTIPLFCIKYHDYPGAYLTDDYYDENLNIELETLRAHSILVLIDGRKVFERLEGYSPDGETLESDLHAILPLLERSSRKPIHFLVTKWDILKGLHSFESVKTALMECEAFSNFLQSRPESCIRLIPVSAVGNDFAKFDFVTRTMVKLKGKAIRPYNVDLSIVLTLVDQLFALGRAAIAQNLIPYWIVKGLRKASSLSGWLLTAISFGDLRFSLIPIGLPISFKPAGVLRLFVLADSKLATVEVDIQKKIARAKDESTAFQAILQAQACRMIKFTREFPGSRLTGVAETWLSNTGRS
jgi:hypothetical protein